MSIKKPYILYYFYLTAPLLAISLKEAVKLNHLSHLGSFNEKIFIWAFTWMFLTIVSSAIIGIISDHYCRKKTLIFTLIFSEVSLILMLFNFNHLSLIIDGMFAAVTPVARASYSEIRQHAKTRLRVIAETIMAQAFTWALLALFPIVFLEYSTIISLIGFFIPFFLIIFFFEDARDNDTKIPLQIFKDSLKQYFRGWPLRLLVAFFLFNLAYQYINYYTATHLSRDEMQPILLIVQGVGIFAGCFNAWLFQFPANYKTILAGCSLVFLTFLLDWISSFSFGSTTLALPVLLVSNFIGANTLTLVFTYFSKLVKTHEEGFLYGILEGNQTLAEVLIIPIIFFIYNILLKGVDTGIRIEFILIMFTLGVSLILKKGKNTKTYNT